MVALTMWAPNIAALCKDYRVYAIDSMGQPGKSIPDLQEPIRSVADFAAWLNATLDDLGLDRVFLGGMSFGGWLALLLAITAPERVRKLVLLSPAGLWPLSKQFSLRGMLLGFIPARFLTDSLMSWMGFQDTPNNAENPHLTSTGWILDLFYLGFKHFRLPPETMRIMPHAFSDKELRSLSVPVLLLIGENEVCFDPAKAMARAEALIPTLEGELVPQCNHDMVFSQRRTVNNRVLDFIRRPTA